LVALVEVELIFFDITSRCFEMEGEEEEGIRRFGYAGLDGPTGPR
jgi:hypothetical protein